MTLIPDSPPAPGRVALNPNAEVVLAKRYLRKDAEGKPIEDPKAFFWRVASSIAAEEAKYPKSPHSPAELAQAFYNLMTSFKFLPNSPTLMNAGTPLGQLAACFVLPVGDSIEEIFDAVKHAALIHKSGGGTGFSFSRLRAKESRVGSTGGVASGPISFLRIFNTATEQIKQGGTRRGANMGILRVDHPDILEFISAKEREGEFNNFNLSVALTDAFMQAVSEDKEYELKAPDNGEVIERLKAGEVFNTLVQKAWVSGDPGMIFLDRINADNPTPAQGEIESTNPCGEQPLLPYEACNLGSVNLAAMALPGGETAEESIDWEELKRGDPPERPVPGQRHRRLQVPPGQNYGNGPEKPEDRARGHGLGRSSLPAGHPLRQQGRRGVGREGHGVRRGREQGGLQAPGQGKGSLSRLRGVGLRGQGRGTVSQRHHHHHRPHRHPVHHRRVLLGRRAALRPVLFPPRHGRRGIGGGQPLVRASPEGQGFPQFRPHGRGGGKRLHSGVQTPAPGTAPGLCHGHGHRSHLAPENAGRFPAPY